MEEQAHSTEEGKTPPASPSPRLKAVSNWLFFVSFMIFLMVVIGGITRLTRSGLSIVEWKPVTGILPPLREDEWQLAFEKYKKFPEYKLINHRMDLSEFKSIYFWEYLHRLWGRLIGFAFLIPWIYFLRKGYLRGFGLRPFLEMFILGGLQGALGWFMVKSGLVKNPHVSHYRLAAHLLLAFFVYSYIFYAALAIRKMDRPCHWNFFKKLYLSIRWKGLRKSGLAWFGPVFALLVVQIFYGALTAGLKAGLIANTFPDIHGELWPTGLFVCSESCEGPSFLSAPLTVQFLHRCLAWLLLICVAFVAFLFQKKRLLPASLSWGLALWTAAQFGLGVLTLLYGVPVFLGVVHQAGALILLSLFLLAWEHLLRTAHAS